MDNKKTSRPPKKKLRSPFAGNRPRKASVFPKFRLNLKEPDKQVQRTKQKSGKTGSKLHFRLGGDSSDPLNLNSLIDRDPSEVTPQCSPFIDRAKETSPQIFVQPRDVTDPLNLKCDLSQDLKGVVATPTRKKRKRKRNDSSFYEEDRENQGKRDDRKKKGVKDVLSPKVKKKRQARHRVKDEKDGEAKNKKRKGNGKENKARKSEEGLDNTTDATPEKEIEVKVPEDVEQMTEEGSNEKEVKEEENLIENDLKNTTSTTKECSKQQTFNKSSTKGNPSKQKNKKTFLYGNYNRYYGYRNPNSLEDPRVKFFQPEWFKDKDVLDIGCNIGNVTLQVARDFGPRRVLGIDIDGGLIRAANKYLRCCIQEHVTSLSGDFPISFVVCRGPIISSGCPTQEMSSFPYNVEFKEQNFTLNHDSALAKQKPSYDVILCLSLTKWIHLNWGDDGLKRTFKRMFLMLQPGGKLLLEAQPFNSYSRRKNLSEKIRRNYDAIQFKPNQFVDFLMSEEVGFASYEALGISDNTSKGFQRPLYLFTKSVSSESYNALGVDISTNLTKNSTYGN